MIAIKDMEMPSCCGECNLTACKGYDEPWNYCCSITLTDINLDDTERPSNCPLVEIEERKEGKWEYKQLGFRVYGVVCTNCGYVIHQGYDFTSMEEFKDMVERKLQDPHITMDKFCCKCGAEMRGAENE